jgi:mycothiol system anti-sigma-R factor
MSCGNPHETPCHDVLHSLILFIDDELEDQNQVHQIEIHIQECPPCNQELQHEQVVLSRLKELMTSSCNEKASDALHEKILSQTEELAQQMQAQFFGMPSVFASQVFTQYSRTEFTVDGIETRIEIETTEITHHFDSEEE